MSARNVVVEIAASSVESLRAIEGLRAAVGLSCAAERHRVEVVLRGAAAQWVVGGEQQRPPAPVQAMLAHLLAHGVPCTAELEGPVAPVDARVRLGTPGGPRSPRPQGTLELRYCDA